MTIREWQRELHELARSKGFYDQEQDPRDIAQIGKRIALIHSELSEAFEEARQGRGDLYYVGGKPEGLAVELADAIIRILDWAEALGMDMEQVMQIKHSYNLGRPYMHGDKLC